jgi:hypothetical protein
VACPPPDLPARSHIARRALCHAREVSGRRSRAAFGFAPPTDRRSPGMASTAEVAA